MRHRKRPVIEVDIVDDESGSSLVKKHRSHSSLPSSANKAPMGGGKSNLDNYINNSDVGNDNNSNHCPNNITQPPPLFAPLVDGNPHDIDENLHSRQLAVYGRETMRRLFASNVLISGMQGLGAEIAKNLILSGVKSVTLHDQGNVELWDLSSNFLFSDDDVGKNRALASVDKLKELNTAVVISTLTTELCKEQLSDFQAVVFTDICVKSAIEYNDYCHGHSPPISFIKAEVRGLFGSIFCDFGPHFTVFDVDGKEPHTGIIASISNDNPALVSCIDDERLEFEDGDLVIFSEIHGLTELNDGKPRKILNARPYSFSLDEDTTCLGPYMKGGIVTQVKQSKVLNFKPLREALIDPGEFLLSDFSKFDRPPLLHLAFQALDLFILEMGRFPVAGLDEDAQKLISMVKNINDGLEHRKLEDINTTLLRHFTFGSRAVLNPIAAMFGGIVGQEVMKACSGKFHPLYQFFYFDSIESLPPEPIDSSDFKPLNSRYDAQISVFGSKLQKKLQDAEVFIVGSGALGCEFLKNMALMGVSCGDHGNLTITDDDIIEKSNLTRQFLFRDWNIGEAKSSVAASAAVSINPSFRIKSLQNRVGSETENIFRDSFWEKLDVVINALDNVNARLYVDQKCLYFQKPLLESGTLGACFNTQVIIPHLTENYGASRDPPEKEAPMCTVHSFPHNIDHCLTWARSEFEGLLEKTPAEVNAYLSDPSNYVSGMRNAGDAMARNNLERVLECVGRDRCQTIQDCILWARLRFQDYFVNRMKQLIFTFPEDASTTSGAPFWSPPKRFPKPLHFSSTDQSHMNFIMAASILRAQTFGIPIAEWVKNPQKLEEAVEKMGVPEFEPKKDVKIVSDEKSAELDNLSVDDVEVINELIGKVEECRKRLPQGFRMNPIQFEKDDDSNHHMDLISGLANMRARNYSIPEVEKLRAKLIAGRIIPAIATATAAATGLVCLELYKLIINSHKLEDYRNTFCNLATPFISMAEPAPPKAVGFRGSRWTAWDHWTIGNDPTLRETLGWFKERGLNAYSISFGNCLIYNSMFQRHGGRLDRKMVDLAREAGDEELDEERGCFEVVVACEDDEDNDVDVPQVEEAECNQYNFQVREGKYNQYINDSEMQICSADTISENKIVDLITDSDSDHLQELRVRDEKIIALEDCIQDDPKAEFHTKNNEMASRDFKKSQATLVKKRSRKQKILSPCTNPRKETEKPARKRFRTMEIVEVNSDLETHSDPTPSRKKWVVAFDKSKYLTQSEKDLLIQSIEQENEAAIIWSRKDEGIMYVTAVDCFNLITDSPISNNVIDAHSQILIDQQRQGGYPLKCFFFNSLSWTFIKDKNMKACKLHIDDRLLECQDYNMHVFPLNTSGSNRRAAPFHWSLLVFEAKGKEWMHYNSAKPRRNDTKDYHFEDAKQLKEYVEAKTRELHNIDSKVQENTYPICSSKKCPQQESSSVDCGAIVCHLMECLIKNKEIKDAFSSEDIRKYRARMVSQFLEHNCLP